MTTLGTEHKVVLTTEGILFFSLHENYLVLLLGMAVPYLSHVHTYCIYCSKHLLLFSYESVITLLFF